MKNLLPFILVLLLVQASYSQSSTEEEAPQMMTLIDQDPTFYYEGCGEELQNQSFECFIAYLDESISLPDSIFTKNERVLGFRRFFDRFAFVVEKDGSISSLNVARGPLGGAMHAEQFRNALQEALEASPKWTPGEHKGEKVRTRVPFAYSYKKPSE